MCHHYTGSKHAPEHLRDEFSERVSHYNLREIFHDPNYYPLRKVPLLRLNANGERELAAAEWGLLPFWWKPSDKTPKRATFQRKTYNARSETVDTMPTYREAFKRRRCLMPADEFFEKEYYFKFADDRAWAFAGLWESWRGGDGETVESCTLLTTEPNELVRSLGHPRMPVLLSSDADWALWLDPEKPGRAAVEHLFAPTDPALMVKRPAKDPLT